MGQAGSGMSWARFDALLLLWVGFGILFANPSVASEVVVLKNGRSLSAKSHELIGDRMVLLLEGDDRLEIDSQWVESIVAEDSKPLGADQPSRTQAPTKSRNYSQGEITQIIKTAAEKNHLKEGLLSSMIRVESNFDPRARSTRGAQGLMQLMPDTVALYGVKDSLDAKENVEAGARYLKDLLQQFNQDLVLALAAYNAGPSVVISYQGVPPFPETQTYIRRVLGR
jgi:soluble lytic murein transglycosylase-like protein